MSAIGTTAADQQYRKQGSQAGRSGRSRRTRSPSARRRIRGLRARSRRSRSRSIRYAEHTYTEPRAAMGDPEEVAASALSVEEAREAGRPAPAPDHCVGQAPEQPPPARRISVCCPAGSLAAQTNCSTVSSKTCSHKSCGCSGGAPPLSAPPHCLDNHFDPPPLAWPVVTTVPSGIPTDNVKKRPWPR
jgi:hypothetical protein